jgi:hypothetical protein
VGDLGEDDRGEGGGLGGCGRGVFTEYCGIMCDTRAVVRK